MKRYAAIAALFALALTACSSGEGLTTSALIGGGSAKKAIDEPSERAIHSATTAARAQRCGFNFDPVKHREGFIAAETGRGTPPDQVAKAGQAYDFTRERIFKGITDAEAFCSEERTREIGSALSKQIAGDFSAPRKPELPKSASWWGGSENHKPLDREAIFNPRSPR